MFCLVVICHALPQIMIGWRIPTPRDPHQGNLWEKLVVGLGLSPGSRHLVSIEWAVPHHVVESTTFEASTSDLVALVGRMTLATLFTGTLSWRILISSWPLVLLRSLILLLLMLSLRILNDLVIDVLKLIGFLDCFLECGRWHYTGSIPLNDRIELSRNLVIFFCPVRSVLGHTGTISQT